MIRQNHRKRILERPERPLPRLAEIAANVGRHNMVNGLVGFLFATTGPLAILLAVSTKGGLSETDINSWIFGGYGIGGVLSILFSMIYRQPIGMAWTIPGAVLLGPALGHLSFPEIIGAYLATGVLITVIGLTGWIRKGMSVIPIPIVMGMVCGVFLPFCLNIVSAFQDTLWIALSMIVAFVTVLAVPSVARTFPPILGALWEREENGKTYALRTGGGHSFHCCTFLDDRTGREMLRSLMGELQKRNIQVLPEIMILRLLKPGDRIADPPIPALPVLKPLCGLSCPTLVGRSNRQEAR